MIDEKRIIGQLVRTPAGVVNGVSITPEKRRNMPKEIACMAILFLAGLAVWFIFAI